MPPDRPTAADPLTAVWDAFRASPETLGPTPGVREAWHRGRPRYAVWVLRVTTPAALDRLALAADRLAPHGLHRFTDPHVTLFVAGFPSPAPRLDDDVADRVLDAQVAALHAARLPAPRVALGGLNSYASCPFLEILDPHDTLATLRAPLAALHPELRFARYQPHLTVGAYTDRRPTAAVVDTIAPLRALPPILLEIDAAELVTFEASISGGRLHTRARVVFYQSAAPP